jgi:hypothetical protein
MATFIPGLKSLKVPASRLVYIALFAAALAWVGGARAADANTTQVLPLSGMGEPGEKPVFWDFKISGGARAGEWTTIRVPSNWETEGFGRYYYGGEGRHKPDDHPVIPKEVGNYRTKFTVPAAWQGQAIRIVFDAAMTDTEVFINGKSAGPVHQGGFYRFHYDITPLVQIGAENLLEVTVSAESGNKSVNHAERRGDYWAFAGIYRPVWLEARPAQHIERTAIDARADGSFYAQVYLGAALPAGATATVTAQIFDAGNKAVGKPFAAPVDIHGKLAIVRGQVDQPKLWSAETPHLYRVQFTLSAGTGPASAANAAASHVVTERFGFRTFEVRARDGLYLNGTKIVLKGVNRHCFWPETARTITREQSYLDARLIKEANMNAVRMSHYPPDKHFLEACDELGLYVLNELAGWQGFYDTPTGTRLIGQIVRRDVNHPSILFWDNGNEGGWNREVDGEFDRWDPQSRPVLHPWSIHGGVNTDHYENYASTVKLSAGPDIFMPTEFLHGLYDGGIGASLRDYWDVMGRSPTVGGGFFWVWADEGVVRVDRGGKIDNMGNAAPDGIVGPHREKEGSFFTVKEIWSPVQLKLPEKLTGDFDGVVPVENSYSFTNLNQCTFEAQWLRFAGLAVGEKNEVLDTRKIPAPDVAPRSTGSLKIPTSTKGKGAHALRVIARDPQGLELWTWTAKGALPALPVAASTGSAAQVNESADELAIKAGDRALTFDRATGALKSIVAQGNAIDLKAGPRFVALRRKEKKYEDVSGESRLVSLTTRTDKADTLVEATYEGALKKVTWRFSPGLAQARLDYEYAHEGIVDVIGVRFDLPDAAVKSKRWLGRGPFRVWQNRREGGVLDVHELAFNDPIPGQTYAYPEFKGFFHDWHWLSLETTGGRLTVENIDGALPFFALGKITVGHQDLAEWPDMGLAFLDAIPAMGSKFNYPEVYGPQSQPVKVSGTKRGSVIFRF